MGSSLKRRLRAAGIHFGFSALAAAVASLLVFKLWYPAPFATIAGGISLFLLLMTVDVILGPTLTAVVVSPGKGRGELVRDLSAIVLVQLAAFGYGVYTMALARPVALAFEVDLMRVVAAADVDLATLHKAPPGLRELSWTGPRLLASVKPADPAEQLRSIELGLAGIPLAALPASWRDYPSQSDKAWHAAKPVASLLTKYPAARTEVAAIATAAGESTDALRFLPLMSRQVSWVALIAAPDSRIVGYLPFDGFF